MVDEETGLPPDQNTKKIIYESFKSSDNLLVGLEKKINKDKLGFVDSEAKKTIMRFY